MVPLAARLSSSVYRSWSSSITEISRSVAVSATVQSQAYCDDGMRDPTFPLGSPGSVPPDTRKPETEMLGARRTDHNRKLYPPREHWTPRGVYKAVVVGEVHQLPFQKVLKSGKLVTIFTVGTGGLYNNRRPFHGESIEEFDQRLNTQWHRVAVYVDRVAGLVMQHVKVGSRVYLEGNIESRVYSDNNSGIVKHIQEIAIRANGRIVFMEAPAKNSSAQRTSS